MRSILPSAAAISRRYERFLNEAVAHRVETSIIVLAVVGYLVHLGLIGLGHFGWLDLSQAALFQDPISAIYTPFSFILIYEVFLLVYHLPNSFTASIAIQYEVVSLLIARDIFHDIAELETGGNWYISMDNLYLVLDATGLLLILLGIYGFHRLRLCSPRVPVNAGIRRFIAIKQAMAMALLPVVIGMLGYATGDWVLSAVNNHSMMLSEFKDINKVFYDDFFKVLIMVDVLVLLLSLPYSTSYAQVMRNTGFVISTILIRLSFTSAPILDILLVVSGIGFGVLTLVIYNHLANVESVLQKD